MDTGDIRGAAIPTWQLYGERQAFPDLMHVERIADRAADHGWTIAPHRHAHLHQIFLFAGGQAAMTADGAAVPLAPPVAVNLPPGIAHGFRFGAGLDGFVLTLPVAHFPDLFGPEAEAAAALARPAAVAPPPGIRDAFEAILAEHAGRAPYRATRLRALATGIAAEVARAAGDPAAAPRGDARLNRFTALVAERFREGWRVADYARALNLSPRHLARIVRAGTGQPAHAAIEAARIREACRLLAYTRLPVASVGYAAGFEDPAYFARAFRRATGRSPSAYRAGFDG